MALILVHLVQTIFISDSQKKKRFSPCPAQFVKFRTLDPTSFPVFSSKCQIGSNNTDWSIRLSEVLVPVFQLHPAKMVEWLCLEFCYPRWSLWVCFCYTLLTGRGIFYSSVFDFKCRRKICNRIELYTENSKQMFNFFVFNHCHLSIEYTCFESENVWFWKLGDNYLIHDVLEWSFIMTPLFYSFRNIDNVFNALG